jgi:hypothetical protein
MSKADMRVMRFSSAAAHVKCNNKPIGNRAANNAGAIISALPQVRQLFDKRQTPERLESFDLPICSAILNRDFSMTRDDCTSQSIAQRDDIILFDSDGKEPLATEAPKIRRLLDGGLVARMETAYHNQEDAIRNNKRSNPPHPIIVIGGHADGDGTSEGNVGLAYARASRVYNLLHQDESVPLVVCSFGASRPICPNTEDTKAFNRRVEVKAETLPVQ